MREALDNLRMKICGPWTSGYYSPLIESFLSPSDSFIWKTIMHINRGPQENHSLANKNTSLLNVLHLHSKSKALGRGVFPS